MFWDAREFDQDIGLEYLYKELFPFSITIVFSIHI